MGPHPARTGRGEDAEHFESLGYCTVGLSANECLQAGYGFDQGFDQYDIVGGPTVTRSRRVLEAEREMGLDAAPPVTDDAETKWEVSAGHRQLTPDDLRRHRAAYDASVRNLDDVERNLVGDVLARPGDCRSRCETLLAAPGHWTPFSQRADPSAGVPDVDLLPGARVRRVESGLRYAGAILAAMDRTSEQSIPVPRTVTVGQLLEQEDLRAILELRAGEAGLDRVLTHPRIQKSGLLLVGHTRGVVPTRVQILGETEITYLESLDAATRKERIGGLYALRLSCVVVTRGVEPLPELVDGARRTGTPLVVATRRSSRAINAIHAALDRLLAPTVTLHGVLVDIHGVGVLLFGPSGIGKSECALFLVERGHRLVADDQVVLTLMPGNRVVGRPAPLLRHHMEVRGIGILNIRDLFGATAVREECEVDLAVELCPWRQDETYERLGIDEQTHDLLGVSVPKLRLPITPGRDMGVLLEVAARNQLLKQTGHHPARRFAESLAKTLGLPDAERPPSSE